MSDMKQTRSSQTREKTSRRKPWAPPSRLDAPSAPDGYKHRWIRTSIRGEDDKINVHSKLREGYEPVRSDEHPGLNDFASIEDGQHAGVIGNGGLMLARIPEETAQAKNRILPRTDSRTNICCRQHVLKFKGRTSLDAYL